MQGSRCAVAGGAPPSEHLPVRAPVRASHLQQSAPPCGRNLREGTLRGDRSSRAVSPELIADELTVKSLMFDAPSGERGASHHPADVSVLQEDDGILLPGEKRGGGGGGR